ncbi:MAG: hypothetical protein N2Z68_03000, partial [Patescibacteria group bacterium]|nr:hypothetical protein [Patescibacteria group bacterium]
TLTVSKSGTGSGTVTSTPTGINCGTDCSESYTSGTSVTLRATASAGSVFAGWSGDCSGTGTCTVALDSNKTVTATFNHMSVSSGDPSVSGENQPGPSGTYTLSLKLGHFQGGSSFVEDRQLTNTEKSQLKVEIWTQSTGIYSSGTKVAEGSLDSPISLSPGTYQAVLKGSLPSPYNATKQVPSNCVFFSISSSQSTGVTCTLEAYNENDTSNYSLPSEERPSGAPPIVEVDSSLGSYQFIKNVVDISADVSSGGGGIISAGFATLYNKKVMLVGTRKNLPSYRDPNTGYTIYPQELKLLIYDVTNPFNSQLLKENTLPSNTSSVSDYQKSMLILGGAFGGQFSSLLILDNHPFIYGPVNYEYVKAGHVPLRVKINPDWSLGGFQEFEVKESAGSTSNKYSPLSFFWGLDDKPYALAWDIRKAFGCKTIKILDISSTPASIVGEIDESSLGIGQCYGGADYGVSKSVEWQFAKPVQIGQKLYLVVPMYDGVGRLHYVERSWVSVFDVTSPSNPQFVGKWQMSGLSNQLHFPDASEAEKAKIYADAGLVEVDQVTGYIHDIFPHMGDFQNTAFMTSPEAVKAFDAINGLFRYRNGIIIRKINSQGNFDYVSRYTLCEKEGAEQLGGQAHTVFCGNEAVKVFGINPTFDKPFYGLGGYIKILPSSGTHAYNGLVLLTDLVKSSVVVGLVTSDNKFKVIPDSSNEFLKFADSLSKVITIGLDKDYGKRFLDAHLKQVDNKTFAIFQIHPTSIDVVKLTLTQPRPLPSSSPSFTPQATTMTLTTASATPSTGTSSSIQGTLYSIRSILNNLRRILSR